MASTKRSAVVSVCLLLTMAMNAAAQVCMKWSSEFSPADLNTQASCAINYDDGTGTALYVGGTFTMAGGKTAKHIARWTPAGWSAVGGGVDSVQSVTGVFAFATFDDGTGTALYVGGRFVSLGGVVVNGIAKWKGGVWSPVGSTSSPGTNNAVMALAVYDDGSGPALFAGGVFSSVGGVSVTNVAKWNGSTWSPAGSISGGADGVRAMAVYDGGSGPKLYAGGFFSVVQGSTPARGLVRWNGTIWEPVPGFSQSGGSLVNDLEVHDDGSGSRLYVGGSFVDAGGQNVYSIATWDGASWAGVGGGFPNSGGQSASVVTALHSWDAGLGPQLYVGGDMRPGASDLTFKHLARWDGTQWNHVGGGVGTTPSLLASTSLGSAPSLIVSGGFQQAGGQQSPFMGWWTGASWLPRGNGILDPFDPRPLAFAHFNDGSGSALYVGGRFLSAGPINLSGVARLRAGLWSQVGNDPRPPAIWALRPFDDGSGSVLVAGNQPFSYEGSDIRSPAKWNGTTWSTMGGGVGSTSSPSVYGLVPFGPLNQLHAIGYFTGCEGNQTASNIASTANLSVWSDYPGLTARVKFATVFDSGSGPELYASGDFNVGTMLSQRGFARWNGSAWESLGSGPGGAPIGGPLAVFNDGTGSKLYCGGSGISGGIARWTGSVWESVGTGLAHGGSPSVAQITVFDDGSGAALYIAGQFTSAGSATDVQGLARWNGTAWSGVGPAGGGFSVNSLTVHNDGSGAALYAAGSFSSIGGVSANRVARWNGVAWSQVGSGLSGNSVATTLSVQSGPLTGLYACGEFLQSGATTTKRVAKWNGSAWVPMGDGVTTAFTTHPTTLEYFDDGSGPAVYMAGYDLVEVDHKRVNRIAKWDGTSWSVPRGMYGSVERLSAINFGGGPRLFVLGSYGGGLGVEYAGGFARWDGSAWHAVGGQGFDYFAFDAGAFDSGSGSKLYVGGAFSMVDGQPSPYLAVWNGTAWGLSPGTPNGDVYAVEVFDDGSGTAVYVAGAFTSISGMPFSRIARWNGSSWTDVGGGFNGVVNDLKAFTDPTGTYLIATGAFTTAGGQPANRLAKWNGGAWAAFGSGLNDTGLGLGTYTDSLGPHLLVAGLFTSVDGTPSVKLARFGPCPPDVYSLCPPDVNRDGFSDAIDYDLFISWFLTSDMQADFNRDGFVDAIDYDTFITAWLAGC